MTNGESNKGDTPGEGNNFDVAEDANDSKPDSQGPSPLEEADRINKEKAELLDREEKILDRKEKIVAAEAVGGRARIGKQEEPKDQKEKAKDYGKSIMAGKLPEKEDGK